MVGFLERGFEGLKDQRRWLAEADQNAGVVRRRDIRDVVERGSHHGWKSRLKRTADDGRSDDRAIMESRLMPEPDSQGQTIGRHVPAFGHPWPRAPVIGQVDQSL